MNTAFAPELAAISVVNGNEDDLEMLAETNSSIDRSHVNGSNIALLLEYNGCRIALSGDAFESDLVDGLAAVRNGVPIAVDAFKLPHHGSKKTFHRNFYSRWNVHAGCFLRMVPNSSTQTLSLLHVQ